MKRMFVFAMACVMALSMFAGFAFAPETAVTASAASYSCHGHEGVTYERPLTDCQRVNRSNEKAHFGDVVVGKWNCRAGRLADSLRFCVANKESYRNTHYITYRVRGMYDTLSGVVSFCEKSERYATARVQIYFDNELAYDSGLISEFTRDASFCLDVSDVEMVRVVCSTPDGPSAYCVVSATVS